MPDVDFGADRDPARLKTGGDGIGGGHLHFQDHHRRRIDHRHAGNEMPDRALGRHDQATFGAHANLDGVACVHVDPGNVIPGRCEASNPECSSRHFFAAAARSTKVLPPFILWASGASLIWITTLSASTPRFFTSACVMSRIMPAFWSSVRPAAMLMVISGIVVSPFSLAHALAMNSVLILRSGLLAASRRMRLLSSWFETAQGRLLT